MFAVTHHFTSSAAKWKSSIILTMMHQYREKNHDSMDVVGNRKKNAENETRLVLVRGPPHHAATTKNDQLEQF